MEMEGQEQLKEAMDIEMVDAQPKEQVETFKKPQFCLVGPRKSKGTKIRVVDGPSNNSLKEEKTETTEALIECPPSEEVAPDTPKEAIKPVENSVNVLNEPEHRTSKPRKSAPAQKLKETPIPYLEPKWGGIPSVRYSLDVIKSGTVLDPIDLGDKSYFVFGRQTNCDVQMAHPTVSRHHAILQYSKGTDDKPQGYYLFDLGSTHGTFLNKNRVRPEMFIRIKVGHQIKLGGSTRLYLLQGPPEDMEDESDLTVTELKAKRQLELQARELAELQFKQKEEEEQKKREEEGIDWGIGDDADEETDLSENPYAITTNEELYIDDPKKTLRGWFEREGHELDYEVEEKGPGQFLCRVEVPIEGARGGCMVAEALVKGKKKEAVAQCALEACRLLDRLGLLRQANHESRKRKAKNWEEEDFYDSDEDTFLDRTGAVEKKRQQRMKQAGKVEEQVETYQSLCAKHSDILKQLEDTQAQLQKAQANLAALKLKEKKEEGDSLESFMSNLSSVGCVDKKQISKLKVDLAALVKEEVQIRRLVNIARPTSLPELVAPATTSDTPDTKEALKNKLMLAVRKKATEKLKNAPSTSTNQNLHPSKACAFEDQEEEEEEEDKDPEKTEKPCNTHNKSELNISPKETKTGLDRLSSKTEEIIIGPSKPSFLKSTNESAEIEDVSTTRHERNLNERDHSNSSNEDDDDERCLKVAEKRKKRNRRRMLQRNEKALERTKTYDASDPNYSVWVPPEDQSGDGTTKLNAKLGY